MSTQKNLITLCVAAVFALGLAACGGGGSKTTPPTMPPGPELTLAGVQMAMAVEAGTYRIDDDLADALDNADPADAALLGVDHAEGTTIEVAGLMLTCGTGPCRVTLNDDGTVTTTGTIWTAGYMPPPTAEDVAAATAAAATKRTAIEAEAAQDTDGGLGGSTASALTAGDAGSYALSIARDRMATTITVTVNGATDDDDVTFMKADDLDGAAGHEGQMLTRTMEADADGNVVTEVAAVVTDIAAPMAVAFAMWEADLAGATPQALDTSTDTTNDTPDATNEGLAVDETSADVRALVKSASFVPGAGSGTTQLAFAFDDAATTDMDEAEEVAGTYNGAMGTYRCNGTAACTVDIDAMGAIAAMSDGWVFIPDEGATSNQPDYDYLHYGFWLKKTTDADGAVAYDEVETFAGSSVAQSTGLGSVTGRATYEGGAAGVYVRESYKATDGSVDTATSGHFTADASLVAHFGQTVDDPGTTDVTEGGDIPPNLLNSLSGTIDNFVLSGGEANEWSVNLGQGAVADGGTASGAANGGGAAGTWNAVFHGPTADDTQPHTVVGEFNANFGNGIVAGGFGARKQ